MLDAFIIEELKKRDERRREDRRPCLDIPLDEERPPECDQDEDDDEDEEEDDDRGVIIIDYGS